MYWFLIFVLSPVMIPEVTARWNSPQISSCFLRGEFSCDRGSWKSEGEVISWSLELAFNYFFHTVDNAISWNILLKFSVDWRNCFSVLIFYQPAFVVDQITFLISTTKSILFSFLWFFSCVQGMDGSHQKILRQTSEHEPWRAGCKTAQESGSDNRWGAQAEFQ